ncbi:tRNA methyltransferase 10 A [Histomonas meleagridis]|uniref:tRNA methyltransferase 10-like A n=1 Tax=Histomonas meleagridis TaxID=135588 RepID=UPI003559509F|nr:tRNA methyltransferase 10 A [Histomonas meleagridis]KAH0799660.1 tRNA methyltransferase 10-like A [Histomonas meleagridis]
MAYSFNKASNFSLPMIFTSMNPTWDALFNRVSAFGWNKKIVTFHNESLLDVFQTKDLIYLTADTDNVCMKLDPSKYYIIGCLLDHNSKKGVTRDFALKNNIRMERLPISEHIKMEGRQVLTINHVAEILVRVGNGLSWGEALVQTIPQRKNPILITKQENTQKIEEQSGVFKLCEIQ